MFREPYRRLAVLLIVAAVFPLVCLPFGVILGYLGLVVIAVGQTGRWCLGTLERPPAHEAALWAISLGLVLALHGIALGLDTPLAGAPPTEDQRRLGRGLAYLGATLAVVAALVAYLLERRPSAATHAHAKPESPDDLGDF